MFWRTLFNDADGAKNAGVKNKNINKILGEVEQAKKRYHGDIRADKDGNLYKFDIAHKERKVHLEKIEKNAKGFKNIAEVDPETGVILKYLRNRPLGK